MWSNKPGEGVIKKVSCIVILTMVLAFAPDASVSVAQGECGGGFEPGTECSVFLDCKNACEGGFEPGTKCSVDQNCKNACEGGTAPGSFCMIASQCAGGGTCTDIGTCTNIGKCVVLPVELTYFRAISTSSGGVQLHWQTASETNNAGFDIEQEIGTNVFESIAFVEGHGTTREPQEYTYFVADLSIGRYVFRLKQIDFDGAFEYSEQVEAIVTVPDQYVLESAYPNPFNPSTTIRFAVAVEQPVTLTLNDSQGRTVRTLYTGTAAPNETHSVHINGEGLASGVYVVRLVGDGFTATERVTLAK